MALELSYPKLLDLFTQHLDAKRRSESASFLIWYLENYYRLDTLEAVDAVCDNRGDKGTDGIFVNDDDETITIFQSKIAQSDVKSIGDKSLRDLAGTMKQYESRESLSEMISAAGKADVAKLATRLDLANKIGVYELRGEFLSNIDIDGNGEAYLKSVPNITFVGRKNLEQAYISPAREVPDHKPASFDVTGFTVTEYSAGTLTNAAIAPIKAKELVTLDGIADQSLFAPNVRGPLGRTGVNRDIVKSIKKKELHKFFPLFHNGITVITGSLIVGKERIDIGDYYVVNGCQSLTALYANSSFLTDDLRILTKFIKLDKDSELARQVTRFSNNQNGVKPRDFVANTGIQIRLQNEMTKCYPQQYSFEIKRGEAHPKGISVINNEESGLLLMAFDLQEPWATHRRYLVFGDRHAEIFGRPEVTADRIVLCQVISEAALIAAQKITNSLFQKYLLTKYLFMYIGRQIINNDPGGKEILSTPATFVRNVSDRNRFRSCMTAVFSEVVVDLNHEVEELGVDFDYRDKLRDTKWVKSIAGSVVKDHLKQVARGRIDSLTVELAKTK
jgi:hypothetical protein